MYHRRGEKMDNRSSRGRVRLGSRAYTNSTTLSCATSRRSGHCRYRASIAVRPPRSPDEQLRHARDFSKLFTRRNARWPVTKRGTPELPACADICESDESIIILGSAQASTRTSVKGRRE
jgi:hypothetical protein